MRALVVVVGLGVLAGCSGSSTSSSASSSGSGATAAGSTSSTTASASAGSSNGSSGAASTTGSHGSSSGASTAGSTSTGSTSSTGSSSGTTSTATGSSGSTGTASSGSSGGTGGGLGDACNANALCTSTLVCDNYVCAATCTTGLTPNNNGICGGQCGSVSGFTCVTGQCSDASNGFCYDPSCPNGWTNNSVGVCGGGCTQQDACLTGYCDVVVNGGQCVAGCPAHEVIQGNLCESCPSGQGIGTDGTCGGTCTPDTVGQLCPYGLCNTIALNGNHCFLSCVNSNEAPDSQNTCYGACSTSNACASGYCDGWNNHSAGGCVLSCPAGSPPNTSNMCGGYCTTGADCQSGYCDVTASGDVTRSWGYCASSCPTEAPPNASGQCGGLCSGGGTCPGNNHCAEPDQLGNNFCVHTCPNGSGWDAYNYCGGQCGDGQNGDPPVCGSGCCTDPVGGSCMLTSDSTCGGTGRTCFDCSSSGLSCISNSCR
ncbi:MAG: hypothetical protein JST54_01650 [Deltaproteobacteria bacterium]|nr:hypothetical protein [Deltaproteobacteria bacterium]